MNQNNNSSAPENPETQLKEKILADYPRLGRNDTFKFACHPGISCFNHCCGDVNIFLSPYDVIRLKKRLGVESEDFLDKYALLPVQKDMKMPVVMLRMNDDEKKTCPFLTEKGCGVYSDRPWPCRMYPLGLASPGESSEEEEFFFLLKEEVCEGHGGDTEWTVANWIADQGIEEYNVFGELFKAIALHPALLKGKPLSPKTMNMLFMACYDMDKFRKFLFETSFFEKFEIDSDTIEKLKTDDGELLRFGFLWIRFFIFREQTLRIKENIVKAKQQEFS